MAGRIRNTFFDKRPAAGIIWFILLMFVIAAAGCKAPDAAVPGRQGQAGGQLDQQSRQGEWVTVARVVDGDTFVTNDRERVRLIGVNTPENTKRQEPYGREASDFAVKMLKGRRVQLEYDVDRVDKYKRTLAYVYLEDGTFYNALLVAEGYAQVMTVPPNVRYADKFLALQKKAREENRGLWGKR